MAVAVAILASSCTFTFSFDDPSPPPPAYARQESDPVGVTTSAIQRYWDRTYPEIYDGAYEPIPEGRLYAAGASEVTVPPCQGRVIGEAAWKDNAFYCFRDDFVAYDARQNGLIERMHLSFGLPAVGAIFAHEWGHAIQDRAGNINVPAIYAELQADCFAGAWVGHVAAGGAPSVELRPGELDQVLGAVLSFRDVPGSRPGAADAHGSGFDRVAAFQEGYDDGASACVGYFDEPPFITEVPFTRAEARTQGDLMAPKVLPASVELLNDFFSRVERQTYEPIAVAKVFSFDPSKPPNEFPDCGATTLVADQLEGTVFFCDQDEYVVVDVDYLQRIYEEVGDFGVTTLLAVPWGAYVQRLKGIEAGSDAAARAADCYAGGFAYGMVTGKLRSPTLRGRVSLSAGDLDEAIAAFVDADQRAGGGGDVVFARVNAFRGGFFDGYRSCDRAWGLAAGT